MFLNKICFCAVLALVIFSNCGRPKPNTELTVVSYGGGSYQESHKKAFCEPFSQQIGYPVNSVVWNADYGKLKTMVESGNVPWDVVEVTAAQYARGHKENLYVPLSELPPDGEFIPQTVLPDAVGNVYWGTVLAFRRDKFTDKQPKTWTDFWNVRDFPGPRALYDDPRGTLEFALLADGVSKESLYPLDVDRAFKKLDEIKPQIRVWWSDGSQPVQLLLNGTVAMSAAWNGRIYASEQARSELGYSFNGAALELDYWVIPRGSRNQEAASKFIIFASRPDNLGHQTEMIGYGPVNRTALNHVSEKVRTQLPTYDENWKVSFVVDADWWSANEEKVKARWLTWKSK